MADAAQVPQNRVAEAIEAVVPAPAPAPENPRPEEAVENAEPTLLEVLYSLC